MKMRIILLYPPWVGSYEKKTAYFAVKVATHPPLNLAYLAALAEGLGHDVRIIDGHTENISLEEIVERTVSFNPDLIGITACSPFYHVAEKLAKMIKKKSDVPVVLGGPHISILGEKTFSDCFDYGFVGEAEISWPLFLKRYGGDISNIKGLLYRKNGKVRFTGRAISIQNLDSLPFPAWHLLPMKKYRIGTLEGVKNFTNITTVRGCPFKCIFCGVGLLGKVRKRSPELAILEIKHVVDTYGIKHFAFTDDTFTLDRKHLLNLCDLIIKEKLGITFEASTRANLIDEELVAKMVKAGLIRLSFGLESVNEEIRRIMRKEIPLKSYVKANRLMVKYGVEALNSCMIGLPGETEETVRQTLLFLRKSREIKEANISIAVPYPGTELLEMAEKGEYGLKLLTHDFSKFLRYNCATMQVGDLSPKDLLRLQNNAYVSIYAAPWRWIPLLKRSGVKGAWFTFCRLLKSIKNNEVDFLTNKQLERRRI